MKKKMLCAWLLCAAVKLFSIDLSNAVCFLGFESSISDPVINEIITKSNELIIDNFTTIGTVSLVNLSGSVKSIDLNSINKNENNYSYYIYGSIESSETGYTFTLISRDTHNKTTSNYIKNAESIMDVFSVCDQLFEEVTPDLSKVSIKSSQVKASNTIFDINIINKYKVNEWLFDGTPDSTIDNRYYWTGKINYAKDRNGKENSAIRCNNASIINKLNQNYDLYNDFTISIWFSLTNKSFNAYGRLYDCLQWNSKTGYHIVCNRDSHSIVFGYFGEDNVTHDVMTNAKLRANQWYNVIVTFKDGISCLYLNGKLQQMNTSTHSINLSKRYISIGNGFDDNRNQPFYGDLDDILIFSKALNPQEISVLYQTW